MFLQKFIYVNWGNIPNGEFEFGPTNLFSGGNGSGKTTAADAIQTVMTAAHDGLFHFNPGQDESTQRGRGGKQVRTLASYVLGCDDGAYARPESAFGYLAAVFVPHAGEDAEPFTALLAMSAFVETSGKLKTARLDSLDFYVLPDVKLSLAELVREDKAGRYVVPTDQIFPQLKALFGTGAVERYERKKTYLCRLYGALRGRSDAVSEREAMNAARAFSRFMAYKPIRAIDDFVANEILEPKDMGDAVRDVSSMLKRIHTMEADARALQLSAQRLKGARDSADTFIDQWLAMQKLRYAGARRQYNESQDRYLRAKRRQTELVGKLDANVRDADVARDRLSVLQQELNDLHLQQLQVPALRDKVALDAQREKLEQAIHKGAVPLLTDINQIKQAQSAAERLAKLSVAPQAWPGLQSAATKKLLNDVATRQRGEPVALHELTNQDWIDISPLEQHLDNAQAIQQQHNAWVDLWLAPEGLLSTLRRDLDRERQLLEKLERQVQVKQAEIAQLDGQQVSYPAYVRTALDAIQRHLPEADARVLCDHIEVTDPEWQAAIEGYIGGARFGILVEPDFEAEAIKLLRNLPGRDNRARVIQGSKARADAERVFEDADSLVAVLTFSHDIARHYMLASYGQVKRVGSAEALKGVRRGITIDALGAANYAMFRCDIDDADLVFGHTARARARNAKQVELDGLLSAQAASRNAVENLQSLMALVNPLAPCRYADTLQNLLELQRELDAVGLRLERLSLDDHGALADAIAAVQTQLSEQKQKIESLQDERIDFEAERRTVDADCKRLNDQQDDTLATLESAEDNLGAVAGLWRDFNVELAIEEADSWAAERTIQQLDAEREEIHMGLGKVLRRIDSVLMEHNLDAQAQDRLLFEPNLGALAEEHNFRAVCQLQRQLDGLYNRLKNNILANRQADISAMRHSFNNAFVTNLCHAIYQSINDGKQTLEQLNLELESHRFGADRERFYFGYSWVPEFKEYWQFFKAVIDNPALGDGESLFEMRLDKKHQRVRDKLMSMLLDDNEQQALKELARLADYRNYRRYEIYKEPEGKAPIALSQYGTGSGGQLETPAYIIRSAAITSAFRFNEGRNHLRMVLVDEAFSKMDEHRSKEVIGYLTESLGLQLMFIMPSSKSGPFLDLISNQFVFSKCATAQPIGELHSRVLVDRQVLNREAVRNLMDQHRQALKHQASIDFLDELAGITPDAEQLVSEL
ncbi:ATP-binding protein [Simiduia aestuariiviva]|uniref:Chromosome segregation ATPase n=1 Tax=Simiduia aestuariiviva TaxID=1510459 RepID=A0A839URA1_9GAMM|nr:SbcC/MukB-like Walker B domain-containing protein [Simiduia aestuariiviva]MBB3168068.1 chromosome segregation ATPase [Simiduia aestuariiviva]